MASINKHNKSSASLATWTVGTFLLLIVGWVATWLLKVRLDALGYWVSTSAGSFVYWTSAKILLWILPARWLIRLSGRTLAQVFNISNYRGWLLWGGGIGIAIGATEFIPNYLSSRPLLPTQDSFALLNMLLIAPTFEEFLMRGAMLGNLQQRYSFLTANVLSSFMFLALHLPGWFFMGSLLANMTRPIGGALSIFLISLLFGYAAKRSQSLCGGIVAHFLNNLA